MKLITEPNIVAPDDFYEALIAAHRDLDEDESRSVNARLILLLANHTGDMEVLREALAVARSGVRQPAAQKRASAESGLAPGSRQGAVGGEGDY
jgi:hypothetical protein